MNTYDAFVHTVTDEIAAMLGEGYVVRLEHQRKNNGTARDALMIRREEEKIAPVIDMQDFYEEYVDGRSVVDILEEILMVYRNSSGVDFDVEQLGEWQGVQSRIGARMICAEANEDLLAQVPHRRFLDLALIYDIHVNDGGKLRGSAVISNENMEQWGVCEEALYAVSRENLPRLLPPGIYAMDDMLKELLFQEKAPNLLDPEEAAREANRSMRDPMYVMTNTERHNGAVTILYPGILDRFMDRMGWREMFLIPSSIHEMLLLPGQPAGRERELLNLIWEVNDEHVAPSEVLTDSLYRYERHSGVLQRVDENGPVMQTVFGVTIL